MSRDDVRSAAVLVTLLLVARPATAQQGTAEVRGRVTDQQMGALPGVTVTVTNQDTGTFREATSTADGSWFMAALPPGRYQVAAQLDGFKKFLRRDVSLAVGNQLNVDIKLELGGLEETITVSGDSPIIDVTSKEIGGNITTKELSEIPTIARNFTYFAGMLPGIVPTANLASWGSDTLTANGVDSRNNSYLVDGAWDNDDYLGQNNGAQARVPLDAAQEFQVLTGQFDAEFGRTSGAIVNAVIKSGTNRLHGSAFEYFYTKGLRAKDFFQEQNNLDKADTHKNEWGGSVGGPIVKDKLHFFADVERVQLNEGRTIQIPARPDLNYTTVTETRVWDTVYRVDHQINANHSWSARWITEWSPQANQTNNTAVTLTAAQQEWDRDDTGLISLNSVLGSNRVNTMRLSLTREDDRFAPNGFPGCKQNLTAFPAMWEADFADCVGVNQTAMRTQGPNLTYLTFQDGIRNAGTHWITDSPEFSDTFSWFVPTRNKGEHDMKFGFQMYCVPVELPEQRTVERHVRHPVEQLVQRRRAVNLPGTPHDPGADRSGHQDDAVGVHRLRSGQVARLAPGDVEPGPALRRRLHAARRNEQPGFLRSARLSGGQEQHLAAGRLHLHDGRRQIADPDRMGIVLRQDELRAAGQLRHGWRHRAVGDRAVPGR